MSGVIVTVCHPIKSLLPTTNPYRTLFVASNPVLFRNMRTFLSLLTASIIWRIKFVSLVADGSGSLRCLPRSILLNLLRSR
jgi:hypothetical protein